MESVWVACNDLDYLKDKVVESRFISCLDLLPNGLVSGLSIKDVNNRTWESFRFSCRDIAPDGGMVGTAQKSGTGPDLTSGQAPPRPRHRCRTGLLEQSPKRRFDLR